MQPVILDAHGVARFRENEIVQFLLRHGGYDMNDLAVMDFTAEDREQFAQLIGYSAAGFMSLSYASPESRTAAGRAAKRALSCPGAQAGAKPAPERGSRRAAEGQIRAGRGAGVSSPRTGGSGASEAKFGKGSRGDAETRRNGGGKAAGKGGRKG